MANRKDIELVIRTTNLSSKPVSEISEAIDELTKSIADIAPRAEAGEVGLKDLQAVAGKLRDALKGLSSGQGMLDRFREISAHIETAQQELQRFAQRVDEARAAISKTDKPTKDMTRELTSAQRAFEAQEKTIGRYTKQLETLRERARNAGIDFDNIAQSQGLIDSALNKAIPAYQRMTSLIDNNSAAQTRAAKAAQEEAQAQERAARAAKEAAEFRAKADEAARIAKESEYVRMWIGLLEQRERAERDAARAAKEAAEFRAKHDEASKIARDSQYVRMWVDLLEERERAERAAAQAAEENARKQQQADRELSNFRQIGADAEKAAKSIGKVATRVDQLAEANASAGASVRAIVDPHGELLRTISGMERAVQQSAAAQRKHAEEMERTGKSTVNVREELRKLSQTQESAQALATLIDRFRNTSTAAQAAAKEMQEARADVLQYANAVKTATAPNEQLLAALREAQAQLGAAQQRYQQFSTAAAKMGADLRTAGVNTRDLSGEMSRLRGVAQQTTTAVRGLGDATARTVKSTGELQRVWRNLTGRGGRTTLSMFQRMRGEVLSLVAATVGLYGAMEQVRKTIEAVNKMQGIEARLGVAFGQENVGAELQYIREQADRLGLVLPDLADGYSKFSIAARSAGIAAEETRFIFERFSEVGKVYRLTTDEMNGVFKALEQIFSKGSVQAEELRGQLGDRLAGAFYEFARAMGLTTKDLNKWMKDASISSEFITLFAAQFGEKVGSELPKATKTAASEFNRLQSEIFLVRQEVATEFLPTFIEAAKALRDFLRSDDGRAFAQNLGKALNAVGRAVILLVNNFDTVKNIILIALGVRAISIVGNLASALGTTATVVARLGKEAIPVFTRLAGSMSTAYLNAGLLSKSLIGILGLAASFKAGWDIGKHLYEQSSTVRKFAMAVIGTFMEMWERAVMYGRIVWARLTNLTRKGFQQELARIKAEAEAEIKKIQANITDYFVDQNRPQQPSPKPGASEGDTVPGTTEIDPERLAALRRQAEELANGESEEAAKKRKALAEQVARELRDVEEKIAKQSAETLQDRLNVIDLQYRELFAKLEKLGGKEGAEGRAYLETLIEQLKAIETKKWNLEQIEKTVDAIKDKEREINDLIQVRDAQITAENAKRRAGLITEEQARLNIARITNESNVAIKEAAAATIAMIDALKDPEAQQALTGVRANMEAILARTIEIPERLIQADQILSGWADGLTDVIDKFAEAATQSGKLKDGFKAAWDTFRQFAADFLRQIARMILQQMILNALKSNPYTAGAAELFSAATVQHTGGVVGRTKNLKRLVNPAVFLNAPRLHNGGLPGIRSDERAAILKVGEEVLSEDDPRNALNGGGNQPVNLQVINTIDAESAVSKGLESRANQKAIMNILFANKAAFKQAMM